MKHLRLTLAGLALTGGLIGITPQAMAAPGDCPAQPIVGYESGDLTVGTKQAKTMKLLVTTDKNCSVDQAVAVVKSAHDTYRVTLKKQAGEPSDLEITWSADLKISPKSLHNSDAGAWAVRYHVDGEDDQTLAVDRYVRRATRATFNAGPEPVANNKITFAGKLERANWNSDKYEGIAKTVTIEAYDAADDGSIKIATTKSKAGGNYRVSKTFPGPNSYWASYAGSKTTAATTSPIDKVAKP